MRFNLGRDEDYYSQRNNQYKKTIGASKMEASCMCNVTVLCEGFDVGGWYLPSGEYKQPEDNLCDYVVKESEKEDSYYAKHFPAMWKDWVHGKKDAYWPNEVHEVLAHEVNKWFGCSNADKFRTNVTMEEIVKQLFINRMPIPISVKFGKLNHIVLLTGFETSIGDDFTFLRALDEGTGLGIQKFIYDDPYGAFDWKTLTYPTNRGSGNNQELSVKQFKDNVKPLGALEKWAHILQKPAAIV